MAAKWPPNEGVSYEHIFLSLLILFFLVRVAVTDLNRFFRDSAVCLSLYAI